MKRYMILLAVLACLLSGCGGQKAKIKSPVSFYYLNETFTYNSEAGAVSIEVRDGVGYENDLRGLLNAYVAGPEDQSYISPFPERLSVNDIIIEEHTASLVVSDQLCMLTGHKLTLACVCLSKTVMELTGADTVNIRVADRLLGGKAVITISADSLVFMDSATYSPSIPN